MIKDYFSAILNGYLSDPPENPIQKAYLAAMIEAARALIQMEIPPEVEALSFTNTDEGADE